MKSWKQMIAAAAVTAAVWTSSAAMENTIPYPEGYVTTAEGASAYGGKGNVASSPYFKHPDFFNMKETESLTLLTGYKTYQQTTEISCGPAAALTVLEYFGNTKWTERQLMDKMETKPAVGTDGTGMKSFFDSIGWKTESSINREPMFHTPQELKDFILRNLKERKPIMVENIDWSGHWRVIIGYDTMGTETTADDMIIMADPYDTGDHWQDGYIVTGAEKFLYMWFDAFMMPEGQKQQLWLIAYPEK